MEAVSAIAVIAGLVGSLDTVLKTIRDFAYISASTKLGSYAQTEYLLGQELSQAQSSLRADSKNAPMQELLFLLQDMERDLNHFQEMIQGVDRYRKIRSFRRTSGRRDTKAAVTSISLAKDMIHMIRTVQGHVYGEQKLMATARSSNQSSLGPLSTILKHKNDWHLLNAPSTKAQEVFAWIAGPEGQENFHEQCRAERVAGTCEWFLDTTEFKSWLHRPPYAGERAILWCQGRPGIGKTILASKIIDQLQPLHVVAYFYMSSSIKHSASDLVTSLLKQLCLPFHIVPDRLQRIFEQTNGEPGPRPSLDDLLEALKEASPSIHQQITIIVDGLDETNTREQCDFLKVFNSLRHTSWKCLVTSRTTREILPKAHDGFSEFTIEEYANKQDIYNLVKSVLRESEPVDRMLDSDPELRSRLENILTERARGKFYWVTLQVRLILDQTNLSGIRSALNSIPDDIHQIVNSTLKVIRLQDENRAELANRALALLTAAQAPLTAEAMCHALGLAHVLDYNKRPSKLSLDEIPDSKSIIECCMGLIKMEPTTKIVTLAHYDILQEMREQWATFFEAEHTARLAKICIAYLSLDEFSRDPCYEPSAFRNRLEDYPFLHYASRFWGYHARAALSLTTCDADISDDIHQFLKQPMNLGMSLQVSEYNLEHTEKSLAMRPDQFLGISELQIASRHGLVQIVRNLLERNPDMISKHNSNRKTALHEAAQAGFENIVRILINAGANPSWMDDEGKKPLIYAAECGHARIVSILQDHSNRSDHDQEMLEEALCKAAEAARIDIVNTLLLLNIDPDTITQGSSAIIVASRKGHKGVVRLLLKHGAKPNPPSENSPSENIPLHQAIRNGHVDTAALLLDYGANIQSRDKLGRTALFEAVDTLDVRGADLLLTNGIDISCRDFMENSVLHQATTRGAFELVSSFVDRGIAATIENHQGLTPLHLAARYGYSEIAHLLAQKGGAIDRPDYTGQTPLMYAVSAGNTKMCQTLLNLGASVIRVEEGQEARLDLAEINGQHKFLPSSIDYGSNTSAKMPLMAALSSKQSGSAELDHDADVNERSDGSKTPLTLATEAGHTDIVRLLINHGAAGNDAKIALKLAAEGGHTEVLELLLGIDQATSDETT